MIDRDVRYEDSDHHKLAFAQLHPRLYPRLGESVAQSTLVRRIEQVQRHDPSSREVLMGKARLLIVEDDFDISNMLRIYFSGLHYDVDVAPRGADALEKTRQNLPHLIVLDIMLPGHRRLRGLPHLAHQHPHQPRADHLPDPER